MTSRGKPPEMALAQGEAPGEGLVRVMATQLRQAAATLRDPAVSLDEAVHEARKRIKRARALLRLLRPYRRATAERENHRLREAAASLGEARDAAVLVETLTSVAGEDRHAAAAATAVLTRRRDEATAAVDGRKGREAAAAGIERSRAALERLRPREFDAAAVARGLARTVRQGRRAGAEAADGAHEERYHEWRKRAKELRYQLEFLEEAGPADAGARAGQAKDLEEELGEEHNLQVLGHALAGESGPWRERVAEERGRRQERARRIGRELYEARPRQWRKWLREETRDDQFRK